MTQNPSRLSIAALCAVTVSLLVVPGCQHNQEGPPPAPTAAAAQQATAAASAHITPERQAQINAMQAGMNKMKPEQGRSHS